MDSSLAIQLLTPIGVGVVGWLLRRSIGAVDEKIQEQGRRIEQLEKTRATELSQASQDDRIQKLEQHTVNKEDWVRETRKTEIRQERVLEQLAELRGQNQAGVQIGAAVAAALNNRSKS